MSEKIKCVQRIPTKDYAYMELEVEYDSVEDAVIDHDRITEMAQGGMGLPAREWTKVRTRMLTTGDCDVNLLEQMSKSQRYWVNETKLALRSMKVEDDVSEIIN